MPLGKDVSENIRELIRANASKPRGQKRPRRQIIAIALRAAGRSGKKIRVGRRGDRELLWMQGQGS